MATPGAAAITRPSGMYFAPYNAGNSRRQNAWTEAMASSIECSYAARPLCVARSAVAPAGRDDAESDATTTATTTRNAARVLTERNRTEDVGNPPHHSRGYTKTLPPFWRTRTTDHVGSGTPKRLRTRWRHGRGIHRR